MGATEITASVREEENQFIIILRSNLQSLVKRKLQVSPTAKYRETSRDGELLGADRRK